MPRKLTIRWLGLLHMAICLPMLVLLLECIRGAYCDLQLIRTAALRSKIARLRSQAERRAGHLEVLLDTIFEDDNWTKARTAPSLAEYWQRLDAGQQPNAYSAVVSRRGIIVLHSDPAQMDVQLNRDWYDHRMPGAGDDVVHVEAGGLAKDAPAFDVSVPLIVAGRTVGNYHEGLDAAGFGASIWPQQRDVLVRWGAMFIGVLLVDALGIWSLVVITRRNSQLLNLVQRGIQDQARMLAQIGGGLAHQIRNPLHALRINLHILRRSQLGQPRLSQQQLDAAFRESEAEIDTLDQLLRDLLQFAVPGSGTKSEVELSRSVLAALQLFEEDLRRQGISIKVDLDPQPMSIAVDPTQFRQAVSNLLVFAQMNTPDDGQIEVSLVRRGDRAELSVGHSGSSLTKQQLVRIFEPFQSPRESGSGLELALVQCVALEAGGVVTCERRLPSGNRFRVSLPLVEPHSQG